MNENIGHVKQHKYIFQVHNAVENNNPTTYPIPSTYTINWTVSHVADFFSFVVVTLMPSHSHVYVRTIYGNKQKKCVE